MSTPLTSSRTAAFAFAAALVAACSSHAPAPEAKPKYLLVWSSDQSVDDKTVDPDFLAVIDATKGSATYGKIVATGALPCLPGKHLLAQAGLAPADHPSCKLNEAHHMGMEVYEDPETKHRYVYVSGVVSSNVFRFDVTDPLHVPEAELVVAATDLKTLSAPDDFMRLPNGHYVVTGMGAKNLKSPGGLIEFDPKGAGTFLAEHSANKPGGPERYIPSVYGETDTGKLAHPHGIDVRADLDLLLTSDYSEPLALVTHPGTPTANYGPLLFDNGTTVRTWKLSDLAAGPTRVIQLPAGPRKERFALMRENEGVMDVKLHRRPGHKGAFAFTMGGGAIFYCADITAADPKFVQVWDFGGRRVGGLISLSNDDRFLVAGVMGIENANEPMIDRDYPGQDLPRVVSINLEPLLARGQEPLRCGPPKITFDAEGYAKSFEPYNDHGADCPTLASELLLPVAPINARDRGGAHHVGLSADNTQVMISNYFVDVSNIPGLNADFTSHGDLKVYLADFDAKSGKLTMDEAFKDEITGTVGIDFHRPRAYAWPSGRGYTGNAKPHAGMLIEVGGAAMSGMPMP